MPIYEFSRKHCGFIFERICRGDEKSEKCLKCNRRAKRTMSVSNFKLVGSGFYATDYAKKKGSVHEEK